MTKVVIVVLLLALVGLGVMVVNQSGKPAAPVNPNTSDAYTKPIETINAATDAAQVYVRQGQYANAGIILDRALTKFPQDQQLHIMLTGVLVAQKKNVEALEHMEKAIEIGPSSAGLYYETGVVANTAGKTERAAELFNLAQLKDPKDPRFPFNLAMIQIKQGNDAAAQASLVRAVKLKDDFAEAWGTLAELALKNNEVSLAMQHIERARAVQAEAARWRVIKAKILKRENKPAEAIDLLQGLSPEEQVKSGALPTLADSFGMLHRPLAAARAYANAALWSNKDPELFYQAAIWFDRGGDHLTARDNARYAVDLGHPKAQALLDELLKKIAEKAGA